MALIHRTASEGSPEKSAGSAALSSWALVDIGVAGVTGGTGGAGGCLGGAGGAGGCLGGAGGTALCLGVIGFKGTVVEGVGEDGRSSSSLSGWLSP